MDDQRKTKAQLLEELEAIRDRLHELEAEGKELRENCEVFRNIFELAPHLTSITRIQDGRYLQVNEAFCRLTGYRLEEIIGRTPFDLNLYADPVDRQRLVDVLSMDGRVEGMEIKFQKKDGTFFYNLVSARPYRFNAEDCLLLMATEITPLKRIEESLRESEEKYRSIIENMEEGYFEVDLAGNYTFVNPAVCRYHGRTRKELTGMNNREYMSPETARKVFTLFNEKYRQGPFTKRFDFDFEIIRKDGKITNLQMSASLIRDAVGDPVGFRGISWDVSDQKKIEAERERFREFLETVEDGCFEVDLAGNMTYFNEAASRMFGYPQEEFMGMNNRDYTDPETSKRIFKIFNEIYRTGIPVKVFDYRVFGKDGKVADLELSASLIRDTWGNPIGFRGISRDVTERKKIEAEKERLTEQLNQARKLEAVGTLAGGIAHDFNNLLMGIQGYASLMMLDLDPAHPHFERLKAIEGQIRIGGELTKQLLGYAQGGRYEIVSINLNELLSKTSVLFGRKRQNIRIHHHYARQLWLVEGDQTQIEQVLLSLFMNASEAMPGGGTLFLETANVQLDESFVRPYSIKFGPYVKISVTDTGVGMDEKTKERIFEPFFTTKEMGRGVGLGLAPVYGIIKGHGGLIEVFSEKGEGTTFNIFLPASPKEI